MAPSGEFHDYVAGPHSPLQPAEVDTVRELLAALSRHDECRDMAWAILTQAENLDAFGALLSRYPSPLEEQTLGGRRRGLDTLVDALCRSDRSSFALHAPTQAAIGRALNTAQINFFRLLWHACGEVREMDAAISLRERTARQLRTSVYAQLVEEELCELASDGAIRQPLRARAVRQLAHLWAHRLTWRVSAFFPMLEATWEARTKVQIVGGTLLGSSELLQLIMQGADPRFVELLTSGEHGEQAVLAFREFLFERSSEELEQLVDRMAREGLRSIELDSRMAGSSRDAGSIFYEFFQIRFLQSNARRLAGLPGPKHTAEGYVLLAGLELLTD